MRFPIVTLLTMSILSSAAADKFLVFIGTYTGGPSKGIYSYELNTEDGSLRQIGLAAETTSPSFLAIHPNKKLLYAVNETENYQGKKAGAVTGFKIDAENGKLTRINDATSG